MNHHATETPAAGTFDAPGERLHFLELNHAPIEAAGRELAAAGLTDHAVLVMCFDEPVGMAFGMAVARVEGAGGLVARDGGCRGEGLSPGVVCAVPRNHAAVALDAFAPGAGKRVAAGPPDGGGLWVVCVAFGGTTLAVWNPER